MSNILSIESITKIYPDYGQVLNGISFKMESGEHLSVLGPSGSGKTTLLRLIAGLEKPDGGDIRFNDRSILDIPSHKRNFGMMFQDFALFPHMNVFENIGFGLKMQKQGRAQVNERVMQMLDLVGLRGFERRHVDDLSGGERQRVALARTLAPKPGLLLLDEPLSSLDRKLRRRLLKELTGIIRQLNIPTIFVTHDHEEAFAAGKRIFVMNQGEIVQSGTADDLINRPVNQWVASFFKD